MTQTLITVGLAVFAYVTAGFGVSVYLSRNDLADVMWGPGIFLAATVAIMANRLDWALSPIACVACALIFVWAVRIARQIGTRFAKKSDEDFRYAVWRKSWNWFYARSYLQVFLLQGALMVAVSMGVIAATQYQTPYHYNIGVASIGAVVFVAAVTFEAVADVQLNAFVARKKHKNDILTTGLWAYSRHPNYFGEVAAWWGLWVLLIAPAVANPTSANLAVAAIALISPVTITILILKVSGIPMLEAKYDGNAMFAAYKERTPAFFPWFPKARS